jgi:hypothetical protein
MAKILEFTERFKENYNNLPKRLQGIFDKNCLFF